VESRIWPRRFASGLSGVWAGGLLAIGFIAAPAAFAMLPSAQAGAVVGRMFSQEAHATLGIAVAMFLLLRSTGRAGEPVFSVDLMLALGALFCTVAGYFAIQPMIPAARVGQGAVSFGALHAISMSFYGAKTVMVMALAWRLTRPRAS